MPRKASQAAKKDSAAAESKNEGSTTRRSGRATAKQDPTPSKEATRSRRSSTAAQTAASVADSKTPKRSTSSRRDSTSPSEGRQKSRRESVESPATRVKSTRRATGRVNYKESDGEDESAAPKYDENFESNEDFDDSESDEKTKPKGKSKPTKSPAKGRGAREKTRGSKARRGRPKKQSSDEEDEEENEPIELSEESNEVPDNKKAKEVPVKESPRAGRNRKSRGEVTETKQDIEEKPKSSRRSARASASKEETPAKKRPTRGVQAKRYTEDDDDDIEEIDDSKVEEDVKPQVEGSRKRKRGSTTESNKRLKEETEESKEKIEIDISEDTAEKDDHKSTADEETEENKKEESAEEPMEVDASSIDDNESKHADNKDTVEESENKSESVQEDKIDSKNSEDSENLAPNASKEKLSFSNKQDSVDSSENLDESMHSDDSDQGSRAEQSISSSLEDSQDTKETKNVESRTSYQEESSVSENVKPQVDYQPDSSNSYQELDDSSESKGLNETDKIEQKEETSDKIETKSDVKTDISEVFQNDNKSMQDNKSQEFEKSPVLPTVTSVPVTHSKESNLETLNGSESVSNSAHVIHGTSAVNLHSEDSAPKANGAHELHHNSVSESNQYYPFPGRKYIVNSKLGESIRQSVKDKSFGFVSYNLGISSSDSSIQKEKLLNELNKLDAHIICIQQVSNSFYSDILEPSLDALGFKGTYSQPEESEKGMATFYKSSLFRLSGQSEASLKQLIEKELEVSSLDANDRLAVKTHVKKCGHVLFTHFATVIGMHSLTVANVQVPPTDLSIHALQVSILVREVVRINGGTSRPFLLGGEFNVMESEAPYQLIRDGYLSNDMIEELQRRKDVILPGKENAALVNLLWKSFQHPSSTLCSCYKSVLDREVFIPDSKATSPDLLWYSSDSLYTVGVLDASETSGDRHFSLKADVAFSV